MVKNRNTKYSLSVFFVVLLYLSTGAMYVTQIEYCNSLYLNPWKIMLYLLLLLLGILLGFHSRLEVPADKIVHIVSVMIAVIVIMACMIILKKRLVEGNLFFILIGITIIGIILSSFVHTKKENGRK